MGPSSPDLLRSLLRDVSRSFYLTLRVLPGAIRDQIGLAYLLARASDTIADTDAVAAGERLAVLTAFRHKVCEKSHESFNIDALASQQSSPAERMLLRRIGEALELLDTLAPADQERIREVLGIIFSGQALDVERFALAGPSRIIALEDDAQLEDYTYRVAGCVGEFWTRLCRAHLFPGAPLDDALLLSNSVRFGKGLQLVNILRDLPRDLRLGRCYLPRLSLQALGLEPGALLEPAQAARLRPLYAHWLNAAEAHLAAGWRYTTSLPRNQVRLRLACAWPILIGVQTLAKLREGPVLDPAQRIKISRSTVRQVVLRSVFYYPWPARWETLLDRFKVPARNKLPRTTSLAK